jgi:hypothetical protein
MFKRKFPTFSLVASDDEWISLSSKTTLKPCWTLLTRFAQIWCNDHRRQQHMKWWWLFKRRHNHMISEHEAITSFPLLSLTHMGVFILILIHFLPLVHRPLFASLIILFNPFDACFLLSTTCVHTLAVCVNHNNFSTSCYIWLEFFIFSTHHN